MESPPIPPTEPPIVVGYNPRKIGRYNLRPNPRPNAHLDFRMLSLRMKLLRLTNLNENIQLAKPNRNDNVNSNKRVQRKI